MAKISDGVHFENGWWNIYINGQLMQCSQDENYILSMWNCFNEFEKTLA